MRHGLRNGRPGKIPILTILLNNGELGGYEKHIPVAIERYGLKYVSGDYAKVAEGLGGYCEKVKQPQEIIPALERAKKVVAAGKPALLEFPHQGGIPNALLLELNRITGQKDDKFGHFARLKQALESRRVHVRHCDAGTLSREGLGKG